MHDFIRSVPGITLALITKYSERLAMSMKDHGYVYYKQRDVGPNLAWSKQPKYEWEIRGRPSGEMVKTGAEVSLWSAIEKDYLVYCERPLTVNLRWLKDKESKGCHGTWAVVKDKAKQAAKEAVREAAKKAVESETGGEKPEGAAPCRRTGRVKIHTATVFQRDHPNEWRTGVRKGAVMKTVSVVVLAVAVALAGSRPATAQPSGTASPPPPDYRTLVHGFDRWVPYIEQGHRGTINGIASQVIAHIMNTPVKGVFDWFAMPAEMPPWWPSLPRANTRVGPGMDAGTAVLIDKALRLVTEYRTYSFYTTQHRDALLLWNAEAHHKKSPDPKRLDELERPLRYMRYMQISVDLLARQVFEDSR